MKKISILFLTFSLLGCGESDKVKIIEFVCTGEAGSINNKDWNDLATRSGYCGMNRGISDFISAVKNREVDLEKSKGYLFWPFNNDDGFVSIQVLESSVLYAFDPSQVQDCQEFDDCNYSHSATGTTLIVQRAKGENYFENQMINMDGLFEFHGISSYQTVAGSTSQAFVFKEVTRKSLKYKSKNANK